jgi:hypothetical protein
MAEQPLPQTGGIGHTSPEHREELAQRAVAEYQPDSGPPGQKNAVPRPWLAFFNVPKEILEDNAAKANYNETQTHNR